MMKMSNTPDTWQSITQSDTTRIQSILNTWFADKKSGRMDLPQSKRWFSGGQQLDQLLRKEYTQTVSEAVSGGLNHWQQSCEGALALIIALDQFSRNIHRKSATAFSGDAQALAACHYALSMNYNAELPITQRVFFYLPLEHDETVASQRLCVTLFEELVDQAPPELASFAKGSLDYAIQHQVIIEQFGRFPHRNEILGRNSTDAEIRWLAESGSRFGQ
jgi:uncharacterized protein (DUF924 family)